jgi:hypothetical protein
VKKLLKPSFFQRRTMTECTKSFEHFLLWERASHDSLDVKRIYIDMAGDLVSGVVLSQIVYWHLPSREDKSRLQVEKEGELWLAKGRADWWEECRISPKQADRALDVLKGKGLIEVKLFKFGAAPTKHIRLIHENFLRAWEEKLLGRGNGTPPDGNGGPDFPQRSKSIFPKGQNPISTEGENRTSPKGKMDFPERARTLTETTPEITTTAASGSPGVALPTSGHESAAAALIDELCSHGVSRGVARKLATKKPDACRRYLDYLPFADIRTSKGAWLSNAIRDEYGPPAGYEKVRARAEDKERARSEAEKQNAQRRHEILIRREKREKLRAEYRQMEKSHGEAFTAFNRYVENERAKASRIVVHLSEGRREEYLQAFDEPERRLELFEGWVRERGSVFASPG